MDPVGEVVIGCLCILVDPAASSTHRRLGNEVPRDGSDDFLQTSSESDNYQTRIERREQTRVHLEAAEAVVSIDNLDVKATEALSRSTPGLRNGTDQSDAGSIVEAGKDMGQNKVGGGAFDLVPGTAQTHLQEGPIEADSVHARKRAEVGV